MQFHVCLTNSLPHQKDFPWQVKLEVVTRQVCFCLHELSTENLSTHLVPLPVGKRRPDFRHLTMFHFKGIILSRKNDFYICSEKHYPVQK